MPTSADGPWPVPTPDPATRSRSLSYLGKSDKFDRSITDFSERYADQNEKDYEAFADAVRTGRLEATDAI